MELLNNLNSIKEDVWTNLKPNNIVEGNIILGVEGKFPSSVITPELELISSLIISDNGVEYLAWLFAMNNGKSINCRAYPILDSLSFITSQDVASLYQCFITENAAIEVQDYNSNRISLEISSSYVRLSILDASSSLSNNTYYYYIMLKDTSGINAEVGKWYLGDNITNAPDLSVIWNGVGYIDINRFAIVNSSVEYISVEQISDKEIFKKVLSIFNKICKLEVME